MSGTIHLGYVVGTGEPVEIPLRHTAVTGQTQESGKTTTLEGLISRSGLQAVAYVTKRGESSFHVMRPIPPFFQERADWQFVQSLLEASTTSKMDFKQPWIMRVTDGAHTLQDVRANLDRFLNGVRDNRAPARKPKKNAEPKERWIQKPARGMNADMFYVLTKYLDGIMPQLAELPYSTELNLAPGLNVMDLRDYEFALQALVIRSVTDRIREHLDGTINIIPEAWKFAPKFRGSPVRLAAEEFVREAAAMKNFLWIDSQDLAGVADVLMRQVGVWLFGVQRATREIVRALEHIPEGLPARRPRPADIATLQKGQFYVCFGREMHKVYVQPAWMTAAHAEAIARGEEPVESAHEILKGFDDEHKEKAHPAARKTAPRAGSVDKRDISDVDSDRRNRHEEGNRADDHKAAPVNGQVADREDQVWKEKYEKLKFDFDQLEIRFKNLESRYSMRVDQVIAASGKCEPNLAAGETNGGRLMSPSDYEAFYSYVKEKAAKDPGVLQLLRERPEINVIVKRRTLEMNDTETPGRIALLITQKFFDNPQNSGTVTAEFKRRGWFSVKTSNAAVLRPLADIAEAGFLIREGSHYQVVPSMKINIVEQSA